MNNTAHDTLHIQTGEKQRLAWLISLPWLLTLSAGAVFWLGSQWLGAHGGYLLGFAFYWGVWCLGLAYVLNGRQSLVRLWRDRRPLFSRDNWLAALVWLLVLAAALLLYAADFFRAPPLLILVAAGMATINGVCEEILWRGLYVAFFPRNIWLGVVYPAAGFALWHFAPQVVFPADEPLSFVVSTFFLGLAYGWIAYRCGSARWSAISHSLSGILALSGMLATSLLALFAP